MVKNRFHISVTGFASWCVRVRVVQSRPPGGHLGWKEDTASIIIPTNTGISGRERERDIGETERKKEGEEENIFSTTRVLNRFVLRSVIKACFI